MKKEKQRKNYSWKHIAQHIEIIIVFFLIILNIFDLLEFMTPTMDYVDKISGIIALAYIIYLASPTLIILGQRKKVFDALLIICFLLFMANKITTPAISTYDALIEKAPEIIEISHASQETVSAFTVEVVDMDNIQPQELGASFYTNVLQLLSFSTSKIYFTATDGQSAEVLVATTPRFSLQNISNYLDGSLFYYMKFIVTHQVMIEKIAFVIAGILLLTLSLYAAWKYPVKPSSFLHVLHGDTKRFHKKQYRAIAIFLCFIFFFLFIFQLMVEWLGVVIDAPIAFLGVLATILIMIQYRHFLGTESIIAKIGETGEEFYEKFVQLFHTPYGVALGMAGILVIHLLTDFAVYIVSYTLYQHEALYFEQSAVFFSQHHTPLFSLPDVFLGTRESLFFTDIAASASLTDIFTTVWIYFFNIVAVLFLFLAPAYMWWVLFKRQKAHEKEWILVLCFIAFMIYLFAPLFHLGIIDVPGIVGTDVWTSSLASYNGMHLSSVIIVSLMVGLMVFALSSKQWLRRELVYCSFAIALLFFGVYLGYYFIDTLLYYYDVLLYQFGVMDFFVLFYFIIFAVMTLLFYPTSFVLFVYEIIKHYKLAKKE